MGDSQDDVPPLRASRPRDVRSDQLVVGQHPPGLAAPEAAVGRSAPVQPRRVSGKAIAMARSSPAESARKLDRPQLRVVGTARHHDSRLSPASSGAGSTRPAFASTRAWWLTEPAAVLVRRACWPTEPGPSTDSESSSSRRRGCDRARMASARASPSGGHERGGCRSWWRWAAVRLVAAPSSRSAPRATRLLV